MNKYTFDPHSGTSTLTDTGTGVSVKWKNGLFHETKAMSVDALAIIPDGADIVTYLDGIYKTLCHSVETDYPELV